MIETTVLDYLRDRLGVPVTMEVPEGASGTFVVLEKTGSSRSYSVCMAPASMARLLSFTGVSIPNRPAICNSLRRKKRTGAAELHRFFFCVYSISKSSVSMTSGRW